MILGMDKQRDSQRKRVYTWERKAGYVEDAATTFTRRSHSGSRTFARGRADLVPLTVEECRVLVAYIWHREGFRGLPPRVTAGRGHNQATGSRSVLKLPAWARTIPMVCHELAHGIQPVSDNWAHGPLFVRIFMHLLARYAGRSLTEMRDTAKEHRVKVATNERLRWALDARRPHRLIPAQL